MRGSCRHFALRGSIKPPFCYAVRIMPRFFCYAGLTAPFCLSSGAHRPFYFAFCCARPMPPLCLFCGAHAAIILLCAVRAAIIRLCGASYYLSPRCSAWLIGHFCHAGLTLPFCSAVLMPPVCSAAGIMPSFCAAGPMRPLDFAVLISSMMPQICRAALLSPFGAAVLILIMLPFCAASGPMPQFCSAVLIVQPFCHAGPMPPILLCGAYSAIFLLCGAHASILICCGAHAAILLCGGAHTATKLRCCCWGACRPHFPLRCSSSCHYYVFAMRGSSSCRNFALRVSLRHFVAVWGCRHFSLRGLLCMPTFCCSALLIIMPQFCSAGFMPPVRSAGIMPPGSCRHMALLLLLASSSACRRVAQQLGGCRHLSCCSAVEHMPPVCHAWPAAF